MGNLLERIAEIAENENISIGKLEQQIGASKGVISRALANNSDIQSKWIINLVENYPRYSIDWLISGRGEMLGADKPATDSEDSVVKKSIPLIPLEAFAGYPTEQFNDMPIEEYYQINEFSNADFLIRVKGDSMTPKYNGGDLVACKKIQEITFFQWHRIYVVYTKSQGIVIKRVEPAPTEDCIELVSDNPAYKPFLLKKEEIDDIAIVLGAVTLE